MRMTSRGWLLGAAVALALGWNAPARAEGEQFVPIPSYRVGPYAAGGTSLRLNPGRAMIRSRSSNPTPGGMPSAAP